MDALAGRGCRDGLEGANKGFGKSGLKAVAVLKADRAKPDYAQIVPPLVQARAQAVVWIGSGSAVADGVEALRRAGPKPTREKVQAALESMRRFDLGGLELNFSLDDHTGLDFADLSIVTAEGRFRR